MRRCGRSDRLPLGQATCHPAPPTSTHQNRASDGTSGGAAVDSAARPLLPSNDPVVQRLARRPFKAKIEGSNPSGVTTPPGFSPPSFRSRVIKSICRPEAVRSREAPRFRSASNPAVGYHPSGIQTPSLQCEGCQVDPSAFGRQIPWRALLRAASNPSSDDRPSGLLPSIFQIEGYQVDLPAFGRQIPWRALLRAASNPSVFTTPPASIYALRESGASMGPAAGPYQAPRNAGRDLC